MAERASPRGAAKQGGQAKPWDGRTPISVAAGLILLVALLPKVLLKPCKLSHAVSGASHACSSAASYQHRIMRLLQTPDLKGGMTTLH